MKLLAVIITAQCDCSEISEICQACQKLCICVQSVECWFVELCCSYLTSSTVRRLYWMWSDLWQRTADPFSLLQSLESFSSISSQLSASSSSATTSWLKWMLWMLSALTKVCSLSITCKIMGQFILFKVMGHSIESYTQLAAHLHASWTHFVTLTLWWMYGYNVNHCWLFCAFILWWCNVAGLHQSSNQSFFFCTFIYKDVGKFLYNFVICFIIYSFIYKTDVPWMVLSDNFSLEQYVIFFVTIYCWCLHLLHPVCHICIWCSLVAWSQFNEVNWCCWFRLSGRVSANCSYSAENLNKMACQ